MTENTISLTVQPKTIYTDIASMPTPMLLGLTIHYYNHSDATLYMKIFGSGSSPWNSNAVELGSLASGSNAFKNLDNFLSRTKPSSATTESLTLTLRGYSDSGYSTLLYEFSRSVTVVFIKSDDGSWTQDVLNNFDDGTVQGWAATLEAGTGKWLNVETDYVLSVPYSLWMEVAGGAGETRGSIYKSFTTPNKTNVYAIVNVRVHPENSYVHAKNIAIQRESTIIMFIGRPYIAATGTEIPLNKWIRIVVPLPANTTLQMRIRINAWMNVGPYPIFMWLDDFKIISK